jgi:(S)-2-hydroxyglutarate dehydrogenase
MATSSGIDWSGDIVVVGGGIVGLAVAREILKRKPETKLAVLEKEVDLGQHQTGHNSGVIHSGIYYAPGSRKAQACVAGAEALKRYCDRKQIPYRMVGKVIVATEEEELPRLENLYQRGIQNEVPGLRMVDADELRELEPHVNGIRALWSPATGIVDYGKVANAYADDVREMGGIIRRDHEVTAINRKAGRSLVTTPKGEFEASTVVTCAGVYADRVAMLTGSPRTPRVVPFRGDYYILNPKRSSLVRSNIYPVPDPRFPFLGVHFTPRMNGDIWLGPNAVLAFSREGYRFRDINPGDLVDMFGYSGFRQFARRNWQTGKDEMVRDLSKKQFLQTLQRYIPELTMDDLLPGPSGVRAQALSEDGQLVDDFVFDRGEGVLHVRNAPSPAATSSLHIGSMIVDELELMLA